MCLVECWIWLAEVFNFLLLLNFHPEKFCLQNFWDSYRKDLFMYLFSLHIVWCDDYCSSVSEVASDKQLIWIFNHSPCEGLEKSTFAGHPSQLHNKFVSLIQQFVINTDLSPWLWTIFLCSLIFSSMSFSIRRFNMLIRHVVVLQNFVQ